jgi:hypothetical protein
MAELDRQVEKELNRLDREHSPGPPRRKRSQHFDWALRFQIIGHSVPDIATTLRNGDGDERTINAAIDQVLDTLGFSRRPPRFLRRPKLGN